MLSVAVKVVVIFLALHVAAVNSSPAQFVISDKVINKNIPALTATVGGIGNNSYRSSSGFEPLIYRDRFIAQANSPNRIFLQPSAATSWNSVKDGFLDGADVFIYRIVRGKISLVRQDRVAQGGMAASGWNSATPSGKIIPRENQSFNFRWDDWNRPSVPYYFSIRSVSLNGEVSDFSNVVSATKSDGKSSVIPENEYIKSPAIKDGHISDVISIPNDLKLEHYANNTVRITWSGLQQKNIAGYQVFISDQPPSEHRGYYLDLDGRAASSKYHVRSGDIVIVNKKFYDGSRDKYLTNRVWTAFNVNRKYFPDLISNLADDDANISWRLIKHEPNTLVSEAGETFLRVSLKSTNKMNIGEYNHSGTKQSYYSVLPTVPHRIEVWLRQVEGRSSPVQFKFTGFYSNKNHRISPIVFHPGREWKKFTAEFTPPAVNNSAQAGEMILELQGPGVFDVDNLRVYEAGTEFLDYSADEYSELKKSGMAALRTHAFIKTGRKTYDLEQLTNPGGLPQGTVRSNSLPQTLKIFSKAKINPWLQIEPHFSPMEWLGLVEYLAAPYQPGKDNSESKPWAYKRYQQGHPTPWVDDFDGIFFEIGNETWNRLFSPWRFSEGIDAETGEKYRSGQVYGMYQEYVISILKSSPYWHKAGLEDKVKFVLGGWNGLGYGKDAAGISDNSDYLTIAAYNGGWDEGEGPPRQNYESYFNLLHQISQVAEPDINKLADEVAVINRSRKGKKLYFGTYEAGPGYALNGLNGARVTKEQAAEQEEVMKSSAAGTSTLDAFLVRIQEGAKLQNFFTFDTGEYWRSHSKWYRSNQANASWQWLSLLNQIGRGDMLEVKAKAVPKTSLKPFHRRKAVSLAPEVAVYAIDQGKKMVVVVISRKVPVNFQEVSDAETDLEFELPFQYNGNIIVYHSSSKFYQNNIYEKKNMISMDEIKGDAGTVYRTVDSKGVDRKGLPPGSVFLYIFEKSQLH